MYYIWDKCLGNDTLHSQCLAAVVLYAVSIAAMPSC